MSLALAINGLSDIWFSYQEQRALLIRIQRGQAEAAAEKITQFLKEIEGQLAWATQLPWSLRTVDEWRFDAVRLMRRLPAVMKSRNSIRLAGSSSRFRARRPTWSEAKPITPTIPHSSER